MNAVPYLNPYPPLGCEQCGELIRSGENFVETWDPDHPELPNQIVHDTCVPEGWEAT